MLPDTDAQLKTGSGETLNTESLLAPAQMLYYVHLPKTAGTSAIRFLDSIFNESTIFPARLWSQMTEIPNWRHLLNGGQYRYIRGHFGYSLIPLLQTRPACFTMLREPISRTLSNYNHIVRDPRMYYHEFMPAAAMTDLSQALDSYRSRNVFSNVMTKFMVSDLAYTVWGDDWDMHKVDGRMLLDLAKERLEQFEFVGIVEAPEVSFEVMTYVLGNRREGQFEVTNTSPISNNISDYPVELIHRVQEINELDIELYDYARKLFEMKQQAMRDDKADNTVRQGISADLRAQAGEGQASDVPDAATEFDVSQRQLSDLVDSLEDIWTRESYHTTRFGPLLGTLARVIYRIRWLGAFMHRQLLVDKLLLEQLSSLIEETDKPDR